MKRRGVGEDAVYTREDQALLYRAQRAGESRIATLRHGSEEYALVMDGTLFNASQLRQELERLGHRFESEEDASVVLHSYVQWGEEMLDKFNGAFAMILLSVGAHKVFLARDRIGVKPLFFSRQGGLIAASEIKTVLAHPDISAELDAAGAAEILLLGPGRTPGSGVFRGIEELEPGCCACYEGGNLRLRRYWRLTDRPHTDSFEETSEKVRFLLENAVKYQTNGVGNFGTMLSGGLDSSLISALCARELAHRGQNLDTFSVDYGDNEKFFVPNDFQPNTDTEFIRIMQVALHSTQHWSILSPEQLVAHLPAATCARDLPGMGDVDASLHAFCEQIRACTDVVLSGECADEIFGGYRWYREPTMRDAPTFPWARNTDERAQYLQPWITARIDPEEFVRSRYETVLAEADILPENSATERRIKELVNLNFRYFMQTLIDRGDRMAADHGLEIRMPFCDYRIAEYLYTVPWEMKDHQGREKGLLRHAMAGVVPRQVLGRKKSPYPKTFDPAYTALVCQRLGTVLDDPDAPIFQIVRHDTLKKLLDRDFPTPWYGQLMRRPQTIAFMLQINFWLENYGIQIRDN